MNNIGTQQLKPTETIQQKVQRLIDHTATYPGVILRIYANYMILQIDLDAVYVALPKE